MKLQDYYTRVLQRSLGAWRRRPFPSPFALEILRSLQNESVENPAGSTPLWVHVDRLEPSDNPFREEFRVRFQLTDSRPQWVPEAVEVSDGPLGLMEELDSRNLAGGSAFKNTTYFFCFKKAWGSSKGMDRFRIFVRSRLTEQVFPRVRQ